jgi:hypothetical protein
MARILLEQIGGQCDIKLVHGDDWIPQFTVPFDTTGYTFTTSVFLNGSTTAIDILTTHTPGSVSSVIQCSFYGSTTTIFGTTNPAFLHSWKMDYLDDQQLVRTFLAGTLESL